MERRLHFRFHTDLWVTQHSGGCSHLVQASNLSQGGIFLEKQVKSSVEPCQLRIPLGRGEILLIDAIPISDRFKRGSYGTGYQFLRPLTISELSRLKSHR